jgi:hypothetical protein
MMMNNAFEALVFAHQISVSLGIFNHIGISNQFFNLMVAIRNGGHFVYQGILAFHSLS